MSFLNRTATRYATTSAVVLSLACLLLPSTPAAAWDSSAVSVAPADADKLIVNHRIDYRIMAGLRHAEGKVTLSFTVTKEGLVRDVAVVHTMSKNPGDTVWMVDQAESTVQHWSYSPYLVQGKPTAMRTMTSLSFP